jgi:hypothetical protein
MADDVVARVRERVLRGERLGADTFMPRQPPNAPAHESDVDEAEALLEHRLPDVLRRLYLEVDNGGFGPGYGILGLRGGWHDGRWTAIDHLAVTGWRYVPKGFFPLCHWGCAIYSFVDCTDTGGAMWGWDPNPVPPEHLGLALFPEGIDLSEWLRRWLEGTARQPWVVQEPVTGRWRGATDAEWDNAFVE